MSDPQDVDPVERGDRISDFDAGGLVRNRSWASPIATPRIPSG